MAPIEDDEADLGRYRTLVGALVGTITDPLAEAGLARDARGWFEARGLGADDLEVLAAYPPHRLLVYRKLVHAGLGAALRAQMPRAVHRLGALLPAAISRFLAEKGPRSHYLRDVPRELVEHLAPSWRVDPMLPPFLGDLARHELSLFDVAAALPAPSERVDEEALDLARPVVVHPSTRLLTYEFPVHRLHDEQEALEPSATSLLAYRDPAHEVRYLELTPFGASLASAMIRAVPLGEAVREACEQAAMPVDDAAVARASQLLADLAERGVLLGSRG